MYNSGELRKLECELRLRGAKFIAGVDEAGRGPLAGPVVSAAVILPVQHDIQGIQDSKKLSENDLLRYLFRISWKDLLLGI